jgi:hypothetical protein
LRLYPQSTKIIKSCGRWNSKKYKFSAFSLAQAFTPVVRDCPVSVLFPPAPSGASAANTLAPEGAGGKRKIGRGIASTGVNAWAREKELIGCG